ncbi:exodeoxyribonuclease V subunit gamma [Alysiella filiformis]|uniref:RecBCD enzyme subunit RecC n=1 Tax=Alysiella filiformis DSM 16848 TaxID=1120981 RepID=A0A286ECS7_9NEIS|nr:exodeoxyribonuclease V subunit gamma [Alysiella filiformis]QMT31884.1 exodeoxyribonuclease V subunit gamma [Alysiella filiformis]UBQ57210.1 exodeoxyribonuclease V subunit gamma [Alysiella filiformis DSM 16848]SOD68680.1 DNA helicase/exodeoxyribonuclease V, gamma subunit [Alysiella filiformis DSM 16848]
MLHLYQSNKLEYLADLMVRLQSLTPLQHPMAAEEIVVQSQGMRRFISQYLAEKQGIAANLRFSLPAGLSWRLTREMLPNTPALNPFSTPVLQWRLLTLFQSPEFASAPQFQAAHNALHSYLQNGEYAAYQLAAQLADVFDQYLVYRPNWIEAWATGKRIAQLDAKSAAEQDWQMALWQYLDDGKQQTAHRAQLWHDLMQELAQPKVRLPERFFVFGIATLAPMYLALLKQLALHSEVHILALNPSAEYWGNVIEPAQILQHQHDFDLSQQGHPLLASLGKQGRDFFNDLTEADIQLDIPVFDENAVSGSLLHSLQYHIQTQTLPEIAHQEHDFMAQHQAHLQENVLPKQPEIAQIYHNNIKKIDENADLNSEDKRIQRNIAQFRADNSIQIHSAHSPLRELQILKDQLLQLLHQNRDWQPHDIAVLTPHIEPYAPFIEAVFGEHGGGTPLPFCLSDVKLSRRQPFLYALEQILGLLGSRFETDKLLPLLDSDLILQKFNLNREDLPLLHDTVAQLNIRWGADQQQRAQYGDSHALFTWQQGLERLILGFVLPENAPLWQGTMAHASRPDDLNALSNFAIFIRKLNEIRQQWQSPCHIGGWCERIRHLQSELLHIPTQEQHAVQQLEQALADWLAESALADFQAAIGADTAIQHINRFLSTQSEAGFLRGGITFCSMVPMRSLPFKVLCLIGLNDGDFPRTTKASSFDLIAKHTQKGDRARRDDDRYLFLEAILSAREVLYLSFVGKDIRTDEMRAPSALLNELGDTIAHLGNIPTSDLMQNWVIQHPLQAFSRQYFSGSHALFSSRQDYAAALNVPAQKLLPFINRLPENPISSNHLIIEQKSLIQFWRNPVRHYLRQQLDWQAPYHQNPWQSEEPFIPDTPRQLADAYVQARQKGQDFEQLANELAAKSLLPTGKLGELVRHEYASKAALIRSDLIHSPRRPERKGTLHTDSGSLNFRLNHNHEMGQIIYATQFLHQGNEHGRLFASDKIELLLLHLIYCATTDDTPQATHLIQLTETTSLPPIDRYVAKDNLALWLAAYQAGQLAPQPFFPRVNLAAANALYTASKPENATWQKAIEAAASVYHTGFNVNGQDNYPEVKLIYGRNDEDELPYLLPAFRALTENLFAPLSGCLKALSGQDGA